MKYQVTLYDKLGRYKPVSSIVNVDYKIGTVEQKKLVQTEGIKKICYQRSWSNTELKKYGYTLCKMRKVGE